MYTCKTIPQTTIYIKYTNWIDFGMHGIVFKKNKYSKLGVMEIGPELYNLELNILWYAEQSLVTLPLIHGSPALIA